MAIEALLALGQIKNFLPAKSCIYYPFKPGPKTNSIKLLQLQLFCFFIRYIRLRVLSCYLAARPFQPTWNMHWNVCAFKSMTGIYVNSHGLLSTGQKQKPNEGQRQKAFELCAQLCQNGFLHKYTYTYTRIYVHFSIYIRAKKLCGYFFVNFQCPSSLLGA